MSLSIVMPVYNEERGLVTVVTDWLMVMSQVEDGYLICINDGSADQSLQILKNLKLRNPELIIIDKKNEGHGKAILDGYKKALELGSDFIFQTDSDNQILSTEFFKFWKERNSADMIIANRESRDDPYLRLKLSELVRVMTSFLFYNSIKDVNVPFRLMKKELVASYMGKLDGFSPFAPNIFLTLFAQQSSVKVLGVAHRRRQSGKNSLNIINLLVAIIISGYDLLHWKKSSLEDPQNRP